MMKVIAALKAQKEIIRWCRIEVLIIIVLFCKGVMIN